MSASTILTSKHGFVRSSAFLVTTLALAAVLPTSAMAAVDYTGTDYEPWSYSQGCIVWRATSGQVFHGSTVADVGVDEEGKIKISDTYTFGSSGHPWQVFAKNQSAYTAPGKVLVFDEAGYNNNSDAQFAPFDFGGMWVNALQAENTPYCITDSASGGTDRTVYLGASSYSTYFRFDKSFTFDRNSQTKVVGEATVEIASGETFTINARANKGAAVDMGNTLVLKGEGVLAVTGGLTVDGTIDLTAASRPTIDGDVALNGTILLPAGTVLPYTVCLGTLSGLNATVKIGDDEAVEKRMTISGGAITALDDPVYEFPEDFPSVVPVGKIYTFIGGETPETAATVSAVSVSGTLKTRGYITLNGLSILTGGTLDVQDSTVTATAATYGAYSDKQINGNIIVRAGATLKPTQTDFLDYSGSTTDQTIDIYGTLALGTTRWSIKHNDNCKIKLYPGAHVTGTGDSNGVFDLVNPDSKLNVYAGENGGEVVIDGVVKTRNANTPIWVAANTTLKIGGLRAGGVNKSGDGTLEISGTVANPAASTVSEGTVAFVDTTVAVPLTVNAGKTVTASASEGVTVPLNVTMNASGNITVSGAGTVNGAVAFDGKPTGTLSGLTASTWKGTVSIPSLSAPGDLSVLTNCGNADSVISLAGISGSSYIMAAGNTTYNVGAVSIDGAAEFNNGSSGSTVNFSKLSGTNNLTIVAWAGCSSARYNFTNVEDFSGTLVVNNVITRQQGGTFTVGIGNIVDSDAALGKCLLLIENKSIENPTGEVVYNYDNIQLNGMSTNLFFTTVNNQSGIYIAAAKVGDNYYTSVQEALNAATSPRAVEVLDANAAIPKGYMVVNGRLSLKLFYITLQ